MSMKLKEVSEPKSCVVLVFIRVVYIAQRFIIYDVTGL